MCPHPSLWSSLMRTQPQMSSLRGCCGLKTEECLYLYSSAKSILFLWSSFPGSEVPKHLSSSLHNPWFVQGWEHTRRPHWCHLIRYLFIITSWFKEAQRDSSKRKYKAAFSISVQLVCMIAGDDVGEDSGMGVLDFLLSIDQLIHWISAISMGDTKQCLDQRSMWVSTHQYRVLRCLTFNLLCGLFLCIDTSHKLSFTVLVIYEYI